MNTLGVKGWLGEWLDFAAEGNEAPMEFHLAVGMCMLGAFLSKDENLVIETGKATLPITPRLSAFLIGESGAGKGISIGWGVKLLTLLNEVAPDPLPNLHDESSQEFMMGWLSENRWALIIAEEAATLLGGARDYNKHLITSLTAALDERHNYSVNFLKRNITIDRPLISGLLGSTPAWLAQIITGQTAVAGFPARSTWIFGPERAPMPGGTRRTDKDWADIVHHFLQVADIRGLVDLSKTGPDSAMKTYYADWYIKYRKEQHEKPAHERVKGWLKRKEIWGLRMALVKAASEGVPFIRVEDFQWAIAYLDKMQAPFEECMASLGTIGKFDGRDVVMQHIKRAGGNATMRQLYKHRAIRSAFKTHEDLAKALETLVYSEELRKLISLNTASDHRYALARIGEETEDDE